MSTAEHDVPIPSCGCGWTEFKRRALVVGCVGLAPVSGGLGALASSFFRGVPGRVSLLARDRAGLYRPDDAASPDGRLVGTGDPPAARGGGATVLPLALLFLPIALGMSTLYPWARPSRAGTRRALEATAYLNEPFFLIRAAGLFRVWIALALLLNGWSSRQDHTSDHGPSRRLQRLSGPGTVILFLAGTVFGDRLGDVARAPLGFDDLRRHGDHGRRDGDVRGDDRRVARFWRRPGRCRRSRRRAGSTTWATCCWHS